ncbi:MAG: patatin-like phospholipase family protein [Nitrospiraceae bacterium]|nr:MAG: patatin-like phospholipase family protein [Nitrospiraceae bacterium]
MTRLPAFSLLLFALLLITGCAHYPVNEPLDRYNPDSGYRGKFMKNPERSDSLMLLLTFSGGGTRAAAFSYGVLEELRDTEVTLDGRKRRFIHEVDAISGVSGGSFTAAYYGLFGDRIFDEFEDRFLRKNIQGALLVRTFFNPYNWIRLASPWYDRSDLAAEYYDTHVFDRKTFGDMAAAQGPLVVVNATDMVTGIRLGFIQDAFDVLCSDISSFPVARATAASSAVPILLTPISLRNYAGTCDFALPERLQKMLDEHYVTERSFHQVNNVRPYLDADKMRNIHLVDGGVADNLGLRAVLDRVLAFGSVWETLKFAGNENVHKIAFIVVNAETEVSRDIAIIDRIPGVGPMLKSYSSIAITRYNYETVMLLQESFVRWKKEIRENRCAGGPVVTDPGGCGDIEFYLVEVKFDALKDAHERLYFTTLPTSFKLSDQQVDELREAARRILSGSEEYQRLLHDLK